jgi:hypothetical protein
VYSFEAFFYILYKLSYFLSVNKLSVKRLVGQTACRQFLSVKRLSVKRPVGKKAVGRMAVGEMAVGKKAVTVLNALQAFLSTTFIEF